MDDLKHTTVALMMVRIKPVTSATARTHPTASAHLIPSSIIPHCHETVNFDTHKAPGPKIQNRTALDGNLLEHRVRERVSIFKTLKQADRYRAETGKLEEND